MSRKNSWLFICLATCILIAQKPKDGLTARDLYLQDVDEVSTTRMTESGKRSGKKPDFRATPPTSAQQLGVRYNVVLFDSKREMAQPVDSQRAFRTGECIAFEFEANKGGYFYFLAEGASGSWSKLFPVADAHEEIRDIKAHTRVRVPVEDCIEFTDPPGIERFFLVVSAVNTDSEEILKTFRLSSLARGQEAEGPPAAGDRKIASLGSRLGSRDVRLTKIGKPQAENEQPFTVYAVAPVPRLFLEIELEHK